MKTLFSKKPVIDYWYYINFERPHSGKGMNNRTPFEVLTHSGLLGTSQFMKFPVFILDHHIKALRACTEPLLFEHEVKLAEAKRKGLPLDPKTLLDISWKYKFFGDNAQKVLTYYRQGAEYLIIQQIFHAEIHLYKFPFSSSCFYYHNLRA